MVIFRENTEDVYAGKELAAGTPEAHDLLRFLKERYGWDLRPDSGLGIKPISETGSKRLIRAAEGMGLAESLSMAAGMQARLQQLDDHREAIDAILDKRRPSFQGR